jgi:hypothetical protein
MGGMGLPRILAGGPTRETKSPTFRLHYERMVAQGGCELEIVYEVVKDPGGADRWRGDKIAMVAQSRQRFMDLGAKYDGLFMVDSDVILGDGVLERLLAVDADVVYGVFWTNSSWGGSVADWPQVWDLNPYGWTQETADALMAPGINEVEVLGGGACTLFRKRAFEARYWPLLKSLSRHPNMFAGEDRTYCLGLECRGIKQIAVTGLPIHHCYTLADQTRPALDRTKKKLNIISQPTTSITTTPVVTLDTYAGWTG